MKPSAEEEKATDLENINDVIDELKHDHEDISALFAQLVGIPPGNADRKQLLSELMVELIRHLIIERATFTPPYTSADKW